MIESCVFNLISTVSQVPEDNWDFWFTLQYASAMEGKLINGKEIEQEDLKKALEKATRDAYELSEHAAKSNAKGKDQPH